MSIHTLCFCPAFGGVAPSCVGALYPLKYVSWRFPGVFVATGKKIGGRCPPSPLLKVAAFLRPLLLGFIFQGYFIFFGAVVMFFDVP